MLFVCYCTLLIQKVKEISSSPPQLHQSIAAWWSWRSWNQCAASLPSPSRPPRVSWPPKASQLRTSDLLSHELKRVSSRVALAKSSSFGLSCEAGPWESPSSWAWAPQLRLPCQPLHRSDCYTQGEGPPPPPETHGSFPQRVAAYRWFFPICEAIRKKSLPFVIYPWRGEKRECGRWGGGKKR